MYKKKISTQWKISTHWIYWQYKSVHFFKSVHFEYTGSTNQYNQYTRATLHVRRSCKIKSPEINYLANLPNIYPLKQLSVNRFSLKRFNRFGWKVERRFYMAWECRKKIPDPTIRTPVIDLESSCGIFVVRLKIKIKLVV